MPGKVVTPAEWRQARLELLEKEKEHTRHGDKIAALRANMPMTKVDKDYVFTGPNGTTTLKELFGDKRQLIVYHFMFSPDSDSPCQGCSFHMDQMPKHMGVLRQRNTNYVFISRAPYEKLVPWKKRLDWPQPWYSSYGSDFNYDYFVTADPDAGTMEVNYRETIYPGEQSALSVFYRGDDGELYHTYTTYARGTDNLMVALQLLDYTPLGRQHQERTPPGGNQYHDEITA